MVKEGKYHKDLVHKYSSQELEHLDDVIQHDRDLDYTFGAYNEFVNKYLLQNKRTGVIYETPQMLYLAQAMMIFAYDNVVDFPGKTRLDRVKDYYDFTSLGYFSQPSPINSNIRSVKPQGASCVKIEVGDNRDSIGHTLSTIIKYVTQQAGLGINIGKIRGLGSYSQNDSVKSYGLIPFIKAFESAINSCSQGGMRKGSATVFIPWWHIEFKELIELKNPKGTKDNRCWDVDYGLQTNEFLYQRVLEGKDVALFSPNDVPNLYEAFCSGKDESETNSEFKRLYELYESDSNIRRISIPAKTVISKFLQEAQGTGRYYEMFMDEVNTHTPFKARITMSNLCLEICLPTEELSQDNGLIALCNLAAVNLGKIDIESEAGNKQLEYLCYLIVRGLDNLLDFQLYPVPQAKKSTDFYRSLGVGVSNYAYFLAKNGLNYTDKKSLDLTNKLFETLKYYLTTASIELAKERGACGKFKQLKYAEGILCTDTYNKNVDELVSKEPIFNWDTVRQNVIKYGIRNATLMAVMPGETSSRVLGATNGIEPPIKSLTFKTSNNSYNLPMVVPEYGSCKYQFAWDKDYSNMSYIKLVAVMQKWVCQSVSANLYRNIMNSDKYPNRKIGIDELLFERIVCIKYGIKTLYYLKTKIYEDDDDVTDSCSGGSCSI
jgi:ribonucleoside-diphosphate reductase alpha chain